MTELRCYKCKQNKPVEEFYTKKNSQRGYDEYCKPCRKARSLVYTRANSQKMRDNVSNWRLDNPERVKEHGKHNEYRKVHKFKSRHARRARLRCVEVDNSITLEVLYERDKGVCGICKEVVLKTEWSLDHKKPIALGGSHTWDNVQLAHHVCNSRKGFRPEFD